MKIKAITLFLAVMILTTQCVSSSISEQGIGSPMSPEEIAALTSLELVHRMGAGWNLGNTFDAHWNRARQWISNPSPTQQETLWGNPVTTKAIIDKVKATGFDTIRVPVTWYIFTGPGPEYKIADAWLDRVQEVVDLVIDNGMFCILNTHHEDYLTGPNYQNGWLRLYYKEGNDIRPFSDTEKQELHLRLGRLWEQIAERFKDYNEYLIFEGVNEPSTVDIGNITRDMWVEQSTLLNELMQTFVDTVRAGGGKNTDRHLMVPPYFASVGMDPADREGRIRLFVDKENKKLWVNDTRGRLIASLHYYEPWGFATAPDNSQYFSSTFDLSKGPVSGNINNVIRVINENFVLNGIPVIMGETGAFRRDNISGHTAERVKWAEYYISKLKELGVPSVIWDDGGGFKLLERSGSKPGWVYPDLAKALVDASKTPIKK
ncbi:MAG: glycoside hydrolase family 5 protein [Treponema sp.]|jgi:endoglucanase|nr:glycoside hydrolase family 5 protein [Treponema sp.]